MANDGPVCDRCGLERANYRFCPGCDLFVCASCWEGSEAVCLSCARPNLPGPGQVPMAIRNTIGQRSLGVTASASRLGQAMTGPGGEVAAPAGSTSGTPPVRRAKRRLLSARVLMVAVAASGLLLVALYAAPVLSRLLADAGNSPSPPAVSTQEGAVQGQHGSPKPGGRIYIVRAGDTLRSIARTAYGDEERWNDIYRANRASIGDPDSLTVGTRLNLP